MQKNMTSQRFPYDQRRNAKKAVKITLRYLILFGVAFIMLYPLLWLFAASFRTNSEIFTSIGIIPNNLDFSSFINGWNTGTGFTFTTFFMNSFRIVIPRVIFTLISCTLVAYGFARFNFPLKRPLFALLISTLFLPAAVTRIPMYILFRELNMLNTYVPLIIGTVFAQEAFFIFLLVQFFRGIPKEYDEAATVDGCGSFQILVRILLPLLKPVLITVALFQFIWSFNNFFEPLIYLSSTALLPVSVALRLSMDLTTGVTPWSQMIAMSLIGLLPSIIVFFSAQRHFVEGINSGGLKG